ncbi:hypothetical protein [Mucilaginibacter paludis]|uniref:Molybdenum ABC transporter permease n=1 Tax=Mucilaginibacter paludis DSM 18603 TaxID=714943 RepID=H1YDT1_9SPHI|nr:hypothetical protein [Mucilaginibacter paludis]EHQ24271.1 hypothetical protein Mucpa_0068 [Mucilaginibacter paludis DSM 18603]
MLVLTIFYIVGIVCVLLSLYLSYWRGKRKFNRRNMAGLEVFKSYESSVFSTLLENCAAFLSTFLIIIGLIILLAAIFDKDDIVKITHW